MLFGQAHGASHRDQDGYWPQHYQRGDIPPRPATNQKHQSQKGGEQPELPTGFSLRMHCGGIAPCPAVVSVSAIGE